MLNYRFSWTSIVK